jgi:hypothetical protein
MDTIDSPNCHAEFAILLRNNILAMVRMILACSKVVICLCDVSSIFEQHARLFGPHIRFMQASNLLVARTTKQ